jgi:DNA-nicking Smr family endonuclease
MNEIDLHGYNFHDAKEAVLKFVDTLHFQGEGAGRIIHGHGVIADNLRAWLSEYPHVEKVEQDAFNSGATIVWLG